MLLAALSVIGGCHGKKTFATTVGVPLATIPVRLNKSAIYLMDQTEKALLALAQVKFQNFSSMAGERNGKIILTIVIGQRSMIQEKYELVVAGQAWKYKQAPLLFKKYAIKKALLSRGLSIDEKKIKLVFLMNPTVALIIAVMKIRLEEYWRRGLLATDNISAYMTFEFFPATVYTGQGRVYFEKHGLVLLPGQKNWQYSLKRGIVLIH